MRNHIVFAGVLLCTIALIGCETGGNTTPVEPEPEVSFDPPPTVDPTTYYAHGHLLERQGQYERAIAQYQQALEIQPRFVNARNRLGIVLNQLERHPEASAQFRLAIQDQPSSAQLYNNLGFSLYLEGQYQAAIENFNQALEYQPNFVRAEMNLGLSHGKLGSYATALEHFRNAVPEADAQYNVAVLQTAAGDFGGAAGSLEQALSARPEFVEARQQLRDIARKTAEAEARRALIARETEQDQPEAEGVTLEQSPADEQPNVDATPRAEAATEPAPAPSTLEATEEETEETPAVFVPLTPQMPRPITITLGVPPDATPSLPLETIYAGADYSQGVLLAALPWSPY